MPFPYLLVAATALNMFGQVAEARIQKRQAEFAAKIEQRNAEQEALMLERDAEVARLDAQSEAEFLAFDIQTARDVFRRQMGTTIAQIGASGTEFSGSNLIVAIDQARQAELGIEVMRLTSERRQAQLLGEAQLLDFQAGQVRETGTFGREVARQTGRNIMRTLPLTLGATAFSGASGVLGARRVTRRGAP